MSSVLSPPPQKNRGTIDDDTLANRHDYTMALKHLHCKRCGNCCLYAHFDEVAEEDVRLWEKRGREDILAWVSSKAIGDGEYAYEVWIDPETGTQVHRCPWLEKGPRSQKYVCQIYDVRPSICRYFPASTKHAEEVECRGVEQ